MENSIFLYEIKERKSEKRSEKRKMYERKKGKRMEPRVKGQENVSKKRKENVYK